jgi:hypothetical protein
LYEWLKLGPVQARVDAVEELQLEAQVLSQLPQRFEVR